MPKLQTFVQCGGIGFLLLSILFLNLTDMQLYPGGPILPPFSPSIPLVLAFLFFAVDVLKYRSVEARNLLIRNRRFAFWLFVLFLGFVIGTFAAWPHALIEQTIQHIRFVLNMAAFALVLFYASLSKKFLITAYALYFTPFLLIPAMYFLERGSFLIQDSLALRGMFQNADGFGMFLLAPILGLLAFVFFARTKIQKIIGTILLVFLIAMLLWSAARAAWIGFIAGTFFLFLKKASSAVKPVKMFLLYCLLLIFVSIAAFMILPRLGKTIVLVNINEPAAIRLKEYRAESTPDDFTAPFRFSEFIPSRQVLRAAAFDRLTLWKDAARYFVASPLGYGPAFYDIVELKGQSGKTTHSTIFEALLSGGIFSLAALLVIVTVIGRAVVSVSGNHFLSLAMSSSLVGIGITLLSGDGLSLRWLWIFIALFFTATHRYQEEKKLTTIGT